MSKKIIQWRCEYCFETFDSKEKADRHEQQCWLNPDSEDKSWSYTNDENNIRVIGEPFRRFNSGGLKKHA